MDREFRRLFDAQPSEKARQEGWQLLQEYAPLLGIDYLRAARERLPDSVSVNRGGTALTVLADARIRERIRTIDALLENPDAGSISRATLERPYKELLVLLPGGHQVLVQQRDRIAEHFLFQARQARRDASFNEALTFIETGRVFHPGFPPYDVETQMLAEAQAELRAQRDSERLAALIDSMKADFRSKTETNQVQEAKSLVQELRALGLAEEDPFVREHARRALAEAYARLAASRVTRRDFSGAISLARAGLEQWPEHTELRARLAGYEIALENQRFERTLRARLSDPQPLNVSAMATDLARLQARYPNRHTQMASELAALRSQAVLEHARGAQPIADQVAPQLSAFDALFPSHRGELADDLMAVVEQRIRRQRPSTVADMEALQPVINNVAELAPGQRAKLQAAIARTVVASARTLAVQDPEASRRLLLSARAILPRQQSILSAMHALPLPELDSARANLDDGALSRAAQVLGEAEKKHPRHPDIAALRVNLEGAMQEARQAYGDYAAGIDKAEAREQQRFDDRHARIVALWHDNAQFRRLRIQAPRKGRCHDALSGYGARAGGTCYDLVAGRKGPEMVVVPTGAGLDKAYAIGKYEVSVIDFNHFCTQSRQCAARKGADSRLPVTDLSVAEAEAYARWLSQQASRQTGRRVVYRLPTVTEWEHAAKANGLQPERKFNCRVLSAGEVIAGHALINTRSGQQNGWGLANYAGNAREWVRDGQVLTVRGGAYSDPLTECGPELDEAHSGDADDLTGFRLVRELS